MYTVFCRVIPLQILTTFLIGIGGSIMHTNKLAHVFKGWCSRAIRHLRRGHAVPLSYKNLESVFKIIFPVCPLYYNAHKRIRIHA
jgi:hypothetical protein